MNRLSVAMIAHNEEGCIAEALQSVSWADQIVVVDCGSKDATLKIAEQHEAEVHLEPNRENLNINKNIAIEKCSEDWILILDADEIIPYELAGEIRKLINGSSCDAYFIPRRNHVMGRWLEHGGQYPDHQLRLFRNGRGRFPAEHVHERISIDGKIGRAENSFDHHPYPDLYTMFRKGQFYIEFEANYLFENKVDYSESRMIVSVILKSVTRFLRRYLLKGGFRDGVPGLAAAILDSWNNSMRWIRLWEIKNISPGENKSVG